MVSVKKIRIKPLYIVTVLFVITLAYLFVGQMSYPALWYDESGQFYIAAGLNHYSATNSVWGGIHDIWVNNYSYNLDPGGFSVILRSWQSIATNEYWIRLLPFTFFFIYLFFLYKIVVRLTNNKFIAVAILLLNVVQLPDTEKLYERIADIRSYPMEMCGAAVFFWLFMNLDISKIKNLMVLSLCLCFFCTSRYGFIISSFSFSLLVIYYLFKAEPNIKSWIGKCLVYGIPLLACVVAIYLLTMQHQNASAEPIFYAPYLSRRHSLLIKSPLSLEFYFDVLVFVILRRTMSEDMRKFFLCTILIGGIYMVFSLCGFYPWSSYKAISMNVFVYNAMWIAVLSFLCRYKFVPMLLCLVLTVYVEMKWKYLKRDIGEREVIKEISKIRKQYPNQKVFIDWYINPNLRYACEYSSMKDSLKHIYGKNLVLQTGIPHYSTIFKHQIHDPYRYEYFMKGCDFFVFPPEGHKGFKKYEGYNSVYVREK